MLALLMGLGGPALTIAAASATAHELIDHSNNLGAAGQAMIKLDGGSRISDHLIVYRIFSLFERQAAEFAEFRDVLNLNGIIQVRLDWYLFDFLVTFLLTSSKGPKRSQATL